MLIKSTELNEKGEIFLFDGWHPHSECRLDFYNRPNDVGEVWILKVPTGYVCKVKWYARNPGLIYTLIGKRKYLNKGKMEHFFSGLGGGGLKALIRATNTYFGRSDDVDGGINMTSWDEM
jgi:hypothetical protein